MDNWLLSGPNSIHNVSTPSMHENYINSILQHWQHMDNINYCLLSELNSVKFLSSLKEAKLYYQDSDSTDLNIWLLSGPNSIHNFSELPRVEAKLYYQHFSTVIISTWIIVCWVDQIQYTTFQLPLGGKIILTAFFNSDSTWRIIVCWVDQIQYTIF